jgi:hypothetical protein
MAKETNYFKLLLFSMDLIMFLSKFTCSLFLFLIEDGVMGSGAPSIPFSSDSSLGDLILLHFQQNEFLCIFPRRYEYSLFSNTVLIEQAKAKDLNCFFIWINRFGTFTVSPKKITPSVFSVLGESANTLLAN